MLGSCKVSTAPDSQLWIKRTRDRQLNHPIARAKINLDQMSREEIATLLEDVSNRARRRIGDTSQGDWFLRELARTQGFDGLPHVITKQEMNMYVASGERELFRGLDSYGMKGKTGEDLAQKFRSGELYIGRGLSGHGIYAAYGKDKFDAEGYMGVGLEGAMLRLTLKSNATTISIDKLEEMQSTDKIVNSHTPLRNLGFYATFKGYDAIDIGASQDRPTYMIILNRTAVRVQNESITEVE